MNLKRKIAAVLLTVCVALFLPTILMADNDTQHRELSRFITQVLENNRDLTSIRWIIKEAEGKLKQSGLWPNPELELARTSDRNYNNEGEYTASVGFVQKFPISGRLSKAKDVARVDVALALAEVRELERTVIRDALKVAFELCVTEKLLSYNSQSEKTLQDLIKISEQRLKQAEISKADLNLEKIELQKIKLSSANLKVEKQTALASMSALLGGAPAKAIKFSCPFSSYLAQSFLLIPAEQAISLRPDYQIAQLERDRASAELRLAKAQTYEDWTIGFGYERDVSNFDFVGAERQRDEFLGFRLSIPLPIWNQNEGRINETRASRSKAEAQVEAVSVQIIKEIDSARAKVVGLSPVIEQYENESLNLAEQNVKLLNQSYRDGLLPISAVIQGQQQLVDVRQSYGNTLREYLLAVVELEFSLAANPFLNRGQNE
jgi:cobalt-zinc-cadmium efflux system outer membrane protein